MKHYHKMSVYTNTLSRMALISPLQDLNFNSGNIHTEPVKS